MYVDDVLVIHHEPQKYMTMLNDLYRLKDGSVERPTNYLGACIRTWDFEDGTKSWAIGAKKYIKVSTDKIEKELELQGRRLAKNPATPFLSSYHPELDVSPELGPKGINKFQELLGMLQWIVELGRLDILFEVTALSRFMVNPREGHIDQAYRIMAYLKSKDNRWLIMDPTYVDINYKRFKEAEWSAFYPDAVKEIDPEDPTPLGKPVRMTCFVDADHAGDKITRRSYTGVIILLNNAPISWIMNIFNSTALESCTHLTLYLDAPLPM